MKSFLADDFSNSNSQILLDENYEVVETPDKFRGLVLYPHQQVAIKALLDLEKARSRKTMWRGKLVECETNAAVISMPFGSGKTPIVLGAIMLRPFPRAIASFVPFRTVAGGIFGDNYYNKTMFASEVRVKFTGGSALIKPALILVGSSVVIQWRDFINTYTTLKVFVIGNYYDLIKFQKLLIEDKVNQFDVIVLKNGTVTGNIKLMNMPANEATNKGIHVDQIPMINAIKQIIGDKCFTWAVYDDFDTINVPGEIKEINAMFSVYVSATTKSFKEPSTRVIHTYANIKEALREHKVRFGNIFEDQLLFAKFNIAGTDEFIEKSTSITIIEINKCVYKNPANKYIELLGAMGDEDAKNVQEMMNGDAYETAAEQLGIKSTSPSDIFQRVLDKKYDAWIRSRATLRAVDICRKVFENLPTSIMVGDGEKARERSKHSAEGLNNIDVTIRKGKITSDEEAIDLMKLQTPELDELLADIAEDAKATFEKCNAAIQRVIDNVKEGGCQICWSAIEGNDIFILKCCGVILCAACGDKGSKSGVNYDAALKKEVTVRNCPSCKRRIFLEKDFIFMNKEFDIGSLTADDIGEPDKIKKSAPQEPTKVSDPTKQVNPLCGETRNPKIQALLDIIAGKSPENKTPDNTFSVKHMLVGKVNKPQTGGTRKVIVFANFEETLRHVSEEFGEQKIKFLTLEGTYAQMAEIVSKFRDSDVVALLVNSQQKCAGLNMQFATDVVFMHKIIDSNIEGQVSGRAQRIGRTCNLRLWRLLYENEVNIV